MRSVFVLLLTASMGQAQEEKIYRGLTPEQLESTLQKGKIEFKKIPDKKANTFFYDFKAKTFNLRLYYLEGKQLMVDTLFQRCPWKRSTNWNLGTNFSRAGLGKDDMGAPSR